MTVRSPTPDLMPAYQGGSRLDRASAGSARDMSATIKNNVQGPHCHLDGPASSAGARLPGNLGTGGDSPREAGNSIPSGARCAKVNWSPLSQIRRGSR
jgi:hypothetical protein